MICSLCYVTLPTSLKVTLSNCRNVDYTETTSWLAENAVAPYSVRGLIPLKESGFLVLADSPGLSFETAAPHSGLGESPADIAVDVYLDTSDSEVIDEVMSRVDDLIEVMGYRQVGDIEVERGSIFPPISRSGRSSD